MSKSMINRLSVLVLVAALLIGGTALYAEEEAAQDVNMYFGKNAKACKMCHKDAVAAWEKWPMASSWDKLSDEEKTKEECIKCHVTGYGEPGGFVSFEETPELVGITCEACHGPAGNHMKIPATDVEGRRASMQVPGEDNCLKCHVEEGNPNFKEFKFDEAVATLIDHLPPAEEAEGEAEVSE